MDEKARTDVRSRACAVCGNVVEAYGTETEIHGWQHSALTVDDHPVIPVFVDEIRTNFKCDFCLADHARWALPVETYQVAPGSMNEGDWAACDDCAAALRANDWNKIIYRAVRTHKALGGPMKRATFERMYSDLRTHITGAVHLDARPTDKEN